MMEASSAEKYTALKESRHIILFVGALIAIGSVFRIYNLDALGFSNDESIQGVAVKGILTHGYPVLGSGHIYVRALPYLYLEALSAWLLGWGEVALRLPSIFFNLATIPLVYLFSRDLFDKPTALVATIFMTFSTWEIEFSRVARMYTAFQFFYLLSLYVFYKGFFQNHLIARYATIPTFLVTFTIHELSIPLCCTFLFIMVVHDHSIQKKLLLFLYTILLTIVFFVYWRYVDNIFLGNDVFGSILNDHNTLNSGFSFLEFLQEQAPSLIFFKELHESFPNFLWFIIAMFFSVFLYAFLNSRLRPNGFFHLLIFFLISISCLFHQIGLAVLLLLFSVIVDGDIKNLTHKSTIFLFIIIVVSFTAWLSYALYNIEWFPAERESTSKLHRALSILLSFPDLYDKHLTFLLKSWLGFSIWIFIGFILLMIRYLRKQSLPSLYVIGLCYLFPIIIISFFSHAQSKPRFFFHLYSFMVIIFSSTLVIFSKFLIQQLYDQKKTLSIHREKLILPITISIIIGLAVNSDFSIAESSKVSLRTYSKYNTLGTRSLNVYRPFEIDYRTCSYYVKENILKDDIVISFGPPVTRYVYTEHLDYFVKLKKGTTVDVFTNSRHLPSLDALFEIMKNSRGGRRWILGDDCAFVPNWYTADMCDYLGSLEPYAVCRGKDGKTAAYLLNQSE
jgi:Dolichyl-phosphate-mannose-protein mannosyltransferase